MQGKLSALYEEKKSLLNELKLKESMISKAQFSEGGKELQEILKKLENEGIMSPTLSRKCLSTRPDLDNLFSPGIALSLDETMIKKNFIEKEIISHLKMNDTQDSFDKNKNMKSTGTSCTVLTRDVGVGYVPNKFKSIAVGNDFSVSENLIHYKRGHFEKETSFSSESLESDIDSLNGGIDHPRYLSEYPLKPLPLDIKPANKTLLKTSVDVSTSTNLKYVDKSVSTIKESAIVCKALSEKSYRHKSVHVSPSMSNKYVQASNKCSVKTMGSQTSSENKLSTCDVGVGDFPITHTLCDTCKIPKKSVGVGESDIKTLSCDKCKYNARTPSSPKKKSVGVGNYDVDSTYCAKCQILQSVPLYSSVGVNTTFELSSSTSDIHICDKCSETIHSVAQDLAADTMDSAISQFSSNDSKVKVSKHKLSKLKTEIQPLKLKQTKLEMNWSSSVKTENKESIKKG